MRFPNTAVKNAFKKRILSLLKRKKRTPNLTFVEYLNLWIYILNHWT